VSKPQQPELARSRRGETDQGGRRAAREADRKRREDGPAGPVPPDNRPGHHPETEQDKPTSRS
jgi:hypothetical protein